MYFVSVIGKLIYSNNCQKIMMTATPLAASTAQQLLLHPKTVRAYCQVDVPTVALVFNLQQESRYFQ